MNKTKTVKRIGLIVDILMYTLMVVQMGYVFTGNVVHEWLGIGLFVTLTIHIIIKRKWFAAVLRRKGNVPFERRFADLMIILLIVCMILLMVSSVGISRTIFPNVQFLESPFFHRLLATLALTFSVIHGGMHSYFKSKKKKKTAIKIAILAAIAMSFGLFGVPYMNRHLRKVEIEHSSKVTGEKLSWKSGNVLVVYFTRVGNTNFEEDIDAVSGASLLISDGELMGSNKLIADMLQDILSCDAKAITLTGEKYPSSYNDTVSVAGDEKKAKARPGIEPIDITGYDNIILVYPLWWMTVPMPVATFLEANDFSNKNVYLLATQGSSGFSSSTADIKKMIPNAVVTEAISIYCEDIPDARTDIVKWLRDSGLAE